MDFPHDSLPTRHSLIQEALAKPNGQAWEELLGRYEPFIDKILLMLGLRGADLDDVRQQVLLKLWIGLDTYRLDEGRARFRNWLSTLIRNTAIDWFRSQERGRRHASLADSGEHDVENPEIECQIEKEWQKYILSIALQNLRQVFSGKAMRVFSLSLKGEPPESIASSLDLRLESVYVLKTRVKTRLTREITRLRLDLEGESDD
jgi:RNA polymerase sigma factor (sigma-70 family)